MIGLIWAEARDAEGRPVIGVDNTIPWRIPEDFAHFRTTTSGHPVVMGRHTWESLPKRPLPRRTNVVLTSRGITVDAARDASPKAPVATPHAAGEPPPTAVEVVKTLDEALALAAAAPGGDEVWIMGGSRLYAAALAVADRLEITEIDLLIDGDTFAPQIDPAVWRAESTGAWLTSSGRNHLRYRHVRYGRSA